MAADDPGHANNVACVVSIVGDNGELRVHSIIPQGAAPQQHVVDVVAGGPGEVQHRVLLEWRQEDIRHVVRISKHVRQPGGCSLG